MTEATQDVLSTVSTGQRIRPPFAFVYGPEGAGKTSFACGAADPILLRTEDGLRLLEVARLPRDVEEGGPGRFETFADLIGAMQAIHGSDRYGSVVIDSLSALEPLMWKATCERHGETNIEKVMGGYAKGYRDAVTVEWQLFMDWCRALRGSGRAVVLVGHSEVEKFSDPARAEPYDQYRPDLHKYARQFVMREVDDVLFLNWEPVVDTKSGDFGKKKSTAVAHRRMVYTSRQPAFYAKNGWRLSGGFEIPDEPLDPGVGWRTFQDTIREALSASK